MYIIRNILQITEERRKRVIDLYFNQHQTFAEIAEIERMSIRDISAIIKEEIARRQKHKDQELSAEAYKLFSKGKTRVQVAIELNLPASKVYKLHIDYLKLRGLDKLNTIYKETNGKIWIILKLYKELIKKRHMSIEKVVNVVEIAIHKLPYMESLYEQVKEQVEKMQCTRQGLVNDIMALERRISILNRIAFSSEQDCKRTEQKVQELTTQKDRIEKLIATILSDDNEDYTKLKAIVKENVKVVLSEKRVLISISFAALVQTLQNDPKMIKAIYNISIANNDKDNKNNSITNYLELNKDRILNSWQKNYENLVEALTNNVIDSASSYSNPTLSLPESSSLTFPNLSTQNDTYIIEDSQIYDNTKGDIAD